jgi:hypothetical protein
MDYRDYIKEKFGLTDGSKLLKPSVYPNDELDRDIITLELDRDENDAKIQELHEQQEDLIEQGVGAPEYKKQALASEIELIKNEREQYEQTYQAQTDKLGLLRAIRGARKRMKSTDLSVDQLINDASTTEVEASVRAELRDLKMDSKKVNEILGALQISTKSSESSTSASAKSEHIEEMEQREESRNYGVSKDTGQVNYND